MRQARSKNQRFPRTPNWELHSHRSTPTHTDAPSRVQHPKKGLSSTRPGTLSLRQAVHTRGGHLPRTPSRMESAPTPGIVFRALAEKPGAQICSGRWFQCRTSEACSLGAASNDRGGRAAPTTEIVVSQESIRHGAQLSFLQRRKLRRASPSLPKGEGLTSITSPCRIRSVPWPFGRDARAAWGGFSSTTQLT